MASWIFIIIAGLATGAFLGSILDRLRVIDARLAGIDERLKVQASLPRIGIDVSDTAVLRRAMRSWSAASVEKPFGTLLEEQTR